MLYARIILDKTNYNELSNYKFIKDQNIEELNLIYRKYCRYKQFKSVMPIFDSEYSDEKTDIVGYYDNTSLIAFSLLRKFDNANVEAVQFAWDYANPKLALGIKSLKNECAIYKKLGFKYLYIGGADEYKKQIDGFEILGSI